MLSYGAMDQIFARLSTYVCGLSPAPAGAVNVTGTNVTRIFGPKFASDMVGGSITIDNTAYMIATFTDDAARGPQHAAR